ncbi:hypothetical protein IAR50_005763 [Cryptococcus sp. DSM 104548]
MSLDTAHPAVDAVRHAIANPADPTAWFLLQYNHLAPGPQVIPLDSGPLPVLPVWQKHLQETDQGVLFGYAEIAAKGLVLVYLTPEVGGVKRARAIVHSRAIASMYPDYSAIITIASPGELTEELISERLGLGVPAPADKARVEIPGGDGPNPLAPGLGRGLPPSPLLQKQRDATPMSAAASETGSPSRVNFTERRKPPPQLSALGLGTPSGSPSASPSRLPSASPSRLPSRSPSHAPEPQPVNVPSVEQLREREKDDRNRKPSFTSRLKNTFHRSSPSIEDTPTSSPSNTDKPTPLTPTSPSSPSMGGGRFKPASLGKVFSKKRGTGETPPTSPRVDDFVEPPRPISHDFSPRPISRDLTPTPAPALPPKDSTSQTSSSPMATYAPSLQAAHGHSPYPASTPPGGAPPSLAPPVPLASRDSTGREEASTYHTPMTSPAEEIVSPPQIIPTPRSTSLLSTPEPAEGPSLSPSPSARQVLYDARQKSLDKEREIQERFRRDLGAKDQKDVGGDDAVYANGQVEGSDGYESSIRLAYDDTDTEDERVKPTTGEKVLVAVPPLDALPPSPIGDATGDASVTSLGLVGRGAFPSPPPPTGQSLLDSDTRQEHEKEESQQQAMMRAEMSALHAEQQAEEAAAITAEDPAEREAEEERARLDREIEEKLRAEYEERVRKEREEEERVRREEDERRRLEVAESEKRREEEDARERYLAEEERRRHAEDEERRVAEEERLRVLAEEEELRRLEEEERAREQAAEAERQRLVEEERARVRAEEERRRAEEAALAERKRAEEAARAEKKRAEEETERQRVEGELAKKKAIREGLLSGKQNGGVMLRGWVTAQTYKSMTWRRRHFQLLSTEMRLFKNEGDSKPIQTIFFGPSTSISEAYEESQVKDSFKVVSSSERGDEDFFLFADSAEDKEVVLEGIKLCL